MRGQTSGRACGRGSTTTPIRRQPTSCARCSTLADADQPDVPEPDPTQRQAIDARHAARAELADRFSGLLQFGTAGLRGRLGGGPHRMNRAVVIRAASGLADYLLGELDGVHPRPRVVIGYDARHKSVDFARDSAAVLTAVGIEVLVLPESLPTPVLAFAVRHLDADAGIMVTASHNPREDNGYKVYLGGRVVTDSGQGAQIVPPADAAIAAEIAHVPSVASVPRTDNGWTVLGFERARRLRGRRRRPGPGRRGAAARPPRSCKIVLTPMHGVGGEVAQRVLTRAGFGHVLVVPEQFEPNPDFPSIAFPNPEEPGAIDMATGLASDEGADLVLALDPDADRCAVAVRDPRHRTHRGPDTAEAEGWRMLHGDETGRAAGYGHGGAVAVHGRRAGRRHADVRQLDRLVAPARQDRRVGGPRYAQTLTGFKWISRVDGLAFGYEEALGYCVDPAHVRDKDGISAALLMAGVAARLHAEGRTLIDALDDIARAHGLYLTDQVSARFADQSEILPFGALAQAHAAARPGRLAGHRGRGPGRGTEDDRDGLLAPRGCAS